LRDANKHNEQLWSLRKGVHGGKRNAFLQRRNVRNRIVQRRLRQLRQQRSEWLRDRSELYVVVRRMRQGMFDGPRACSNTDKLLEWRVFPDGV
jgi:hypothetical protein